MSEERLESQLENSREGQRKPLFSGHRLSDLAGQLPERFLRYSQIRSYVTAETAFSEIGCPSLPALREDIQRNLAISDEQMMQLEAKLEAIVGPEYAEGVHSYIPVRRSFGASDSRSLEEIVRQNLEQEIGNNQVLQEIQAIPWTEPLIS